MTERFRPGRSSGSNLTDWMIFRNRWWQHLIFWGMALLILFNIFRDGGSVEKIDVIYTLIFVIPLLCIVYLNLYLAVPRFLRKEKYLLYTVTLMALMTGGAFFLYFLFDRWIDIFLPGFYFISYYTVPVLMIYTGSFLALTTLLKLSRSWFMLLRIERLTTFNQLQALHSQINPHFLLNSLQTIYALSLQKSEQSPEVILQLSHILKYTLYETGQATVELGTEIGIIRDYVEMYRHRLDPGRTEISMEVKGNPGKLKIAPMLLIPFIENSFKHGPGGDGESTFVHIRMTVSEGHLDFSTRNSSRGKERMELEQQKGIGIGNTRQRLQLLYPGRHNLEISKTEDTFTVNLSIDLNE